MPPPEIDPKILLALGLGTLQGCDLFKIGPCLDYPIETGDPQVGPCLDYAIETGDIYVGPCLDYAIETGETGLGPCLDYYYPPDTANDDTASGDTASGDTASVDSQQSRKVKIPTTNTSRLRQAVRDKLFAKGIIPKDIDLADE